jgi:hypothetical protein
MVGLRPATIAGNIGAFYLAMSVMDTGIGAVAGPNTSRNGLKFRIGGVPSELQPRKRGRRDAPVRQKDFLLPVLQINWGSTIHPRAPRQAGALGKIAHSVKPK